MDEQNACEKHHDCLFGPTVLQIEPTLATIFLQFDNEISKLLFCSATLVE
jgi:hypothetical protein